MSRSLTEGCLFYPIHEDSSVEVLSFLSAKFEVLEVRNLTKKKKNNQILALYLSYKLTRTRVLYFQPHV